MTEQICKPIVLTSTTKCKALIERLYKPSHKTQTVIRVRVGEIK